MQPFTKEQIEEICKNIQSQNHINSNHFCSLVQKGNHLVSSCLGVESNVSWIINSRATDHMIGSPQLFSSYNARAGNQSVKIADGTFSIVEGKCSIVISPNFILHNVLYVPKISCNLLSISSLTRSQLSS